MAEPQTENQGLTVEYDTLTQGVQTLNFFLAVYPMDTPMRG